MIILPTADSAFVIYGECNIEYCGRAVSTLERGRYLIIRKEDGSVLVHGAELSKPLNYMSAGADLHAEHTSRHGHGFILRMSRKSEVITITVHELVEFSYLWEWSKAKIKLSKTESELRDKIAADPIRYLGILPTEVHTEAPTEHGPVDILCSMAGLGQPDDELHIVEVKRNGINVNSLVQLQKYGSCFNNPILHAAAPKIGAKAQDYCKEHCINYVYVNFED